MPMFKRTGALQERTYNKAPSDLRVENTPKEVIIAVDATKDPEDFCFIWALQNILEPGDHVTFLGILHRINTPMGYKSQANLSSFVGTNKKTLGQEAEKTLHHFEQKLRPMSDWCDRNGVHVDITITAGSPLKSVLLQEALNIKATHVVLDRNLRRDKKYYQERIKCILVTFSQDNEAEYLRIIYGPFTLNNPRRPVCSVKATDSSTDVRCSTESVATVCTIDSDIILSSDQSTSTGEISASIACLSSTDEVESSFPGCIEDVVSSSKHSLSTNPNSDGAGVGNSSMSNQSTNSVCGSMDGSLLDPPSEDNSFIDLCMLSSPEGIKSVWSHSVANENESLSSWYSNCDEPELETVVTSTKVLSSPVEGEGRCITPAEVQNVTASSSTSVQREIKPICTLPTRTFPSLKELLKDHDFQNIEDSDSNKSEGKFEEIHQFSALDSEDLPSTKNKVMEAAHRNLGKVVPQDVNKQGEEAHDIHESKLQSLALIGTLEKFRKSLPKPPPLCSVCKLKSPEFGKATLLFQYEDLRAATNDFSTDNLIAEGGFGLVFKGTLQEELTVAVKVLKASSLQGDVQFSAEVEALSCAQHRNLVRLIGYCIENDRRALVYEYVCNGSLDRHLSGRSNRILEWSSRHKIAVGAARGLRYLHEECRAGCIVHRDMRPNNILLTHDYTPMVGDFGLAKLSSNGDVAIETQVIGSLGYVAPEYVDCGQVTTKTDVYAFGIVLLELLSGRKAVDLSRSMGEISLIEWARPKLEMHNAHELLDPNIAESVDVYEYNRMVKAASLCVKKDPSNRPGMSQILRILEGDLDEFRDRSALDLVPVSHAIKLGRKTQDEDDISYHEPTGQLENFHSTTRKVIPVSRTWLEWVRTR